MSNGTVTKLTNATVATGTNMTAPSMDLLRAMGHGITAGATEEFVTIPGLSNTVNAANFTGATDVAKITAAIASAVAGSKAYCLVPKSMLPYDASLVTFNNAIRMVREGQGNWGVYDITAYGADSTSVDSAPGIQAALDAAAASNTVDGSRNTATPGEYTGEFTIRTAGGKIETHPSEVFQEYIRISIVPSFGNQITPAMPLIFDGSWILDGSQELDGIKNP